MKRLHTLEDQIADYKGSRDTIHQLWPDPLVMPEKWSDALVEWEGKISQLEVQIAREKENPTPGEPPPDSPLWLRVLKGLPVTAVTVAAWEFFKSLWR